LSKEEGKEEGDEKESKRELTKKRGHLLAKKNKELVGVGRQTRQERNIYLFIYFHFLN
jgi:hypothetical protein